MILWVYIGVSIAGVLAAWWLGRWLYVIINRIEEKKRENFEDRDN